jgi:hypothetical protein
MNAKSQKKSEFGDKIDVKDSIQLQNYIWKYRPLYLIVMPAATKHTIRPAINLDLVKMFFFLNWDIKSQTVESV